MNEIEKMYENAEVKFRKVCTNVDCDCDEMFCDECEYFKDNIFAFTAEKQIGLIKWLSDTDYYIHNIYKTVDTEQYCIENDIYDIEANEFEEALASLINKLWQDLTEEEKQEIKKILE